MDNEKNQVNNNIPQENIDNKIENKNDSSEYNSNNNINNDDNNTKENKETEETKENNQKLSYDELLKEYEKLKKANEKLTKELQVKEKESLDYLDRYRRTLADMENLRKRTLIEKQDSLKYANFNIISDLLIILDDFQRAIDSAKAENIDFNNFKTGIEMIEKQFLDLLFKKYGVIRFGEKNEEFDPNKHQAMMMEEGDYKNEIILEVFRNGYILHDRVIRPAQVKVGKPSENK